MFRTDNRIDTNIKSRQPFAFLFLFFLLFVFFIEPAIAHKVSIFAWVEGDTVYTQSKFSGGKKVKNSLVVVYDKEGNELLKGKTDKKGDFFFKLPKKTDLKIVLMASMGHQAEWKISSEEINQAQGILKGTHKTDIKPENKALTASVSCKTINEQTVPDTVYIDRQKIKELIDESLDRKLAPIINMLVSSLDRKPGMTDIIAGIGYIFGLVGVALYFTNRKKKD